MRLSPGWLFSLAALPYEVLTAQEVWREHCREMMRRFPPHAAPWRVLDLGCGPGNSALAMAAAGAGRVLGVDLAPGMLRRARRAVRRVGADGRRVDLLLADASRLPCRDGAFDAVTGHSFLYLVRAPERVLAEARRVLRPGGALVLMEPAAGLPGRDLVPLLRRSLRFALSMQGWRIVSGLAGRYTADSLQRSLTAAGFVDIAVDRTLGGLGLIASGRK